MVAQPPFTSTSVPNISSHKRLSPKVGFANLFSMAIRNSRMLTIFGSVKINAFTADSNSYCFATRAVYRRSIS